MLTGVPARNLGYTLCLAIICFVSPGDAKKRPTGRGDPEHPSATGPDSCKLSNMFSCDVEEDASNNKECLLRQDTTDDFDWTCNRGKTPSSRPRHRIINKKKYPLTGPASAKSGRNYLFAGTPGSGTSKVARLLMEGSKAHGAGYYCLHFAHCHNGHHIGDLRVYDKIGNGERQTWWSLAGDFGPKWYTAAVQLDLTGVTEVGFEYQTGGFHSAIALDDVEMKPGTCEEHEGYLWACNFETADGSSTMCDLEQDRSDDKIDWTLWRGATPSQETGPKAAYNGKYYIYLEATPGKEGVDARIFFPPSKTKQTVNMMFRYNMFGFHTGTLSICILRAGKCVENVWDKTGPQGEEWLLAEVSGTILPNDRIGFHAIRGDGHSGDIAIDEIRVQAVR